MANSEKSLFQMDDIMGRPGFISQGWKAGLQ